jgi:hypothetical protein
VRILYNAIEREEGAIAGGDGIIITYYKETTTGSGVAGLCRGKGDLHSFGIFSEPKVVRPYGAEALAERCLDLSVVSLARVT